MGETLPLGFSHTFTCVCSQHNDLRTSGMSPSVGGISLNCDAGGLLDKKLAGVVLVTGLGRRTKAGYRLAHFWTKSWLEY